MNRKNRSPKAAPELAAAAPAPAAAACPPGPITVEIARLFAGSEPVGTRLRVEQTTMVESLLHRGYLRRVDR